MPETPQYPWEENVRCGDAADNQKRLEKLGFNIINMISLSARIQWLLSGGKNLLERMDRPNSSRPNYKKARERNITLDGFLSKEIRQAYGITLEEAEDVIDALHQLPMNLTRAHLSPRGMALGIHKELIHPADVEVLRKYFRVYYI